MRLVLHAGLSGEQVFQLRAGANTIGRTPENEICVAHKSLSRRHARVDVEGARAEVNDLGSKNGTWVNGTRVEKCDLADGDTLRCGDLVFVFEQRDGSSRERAAAPTLVRNIDTDLALAKAPLEDLLSSSRSAKDPSDYTISDEDARRVREKLQILLRVSQLLSSPEVGGARGIDKLLEKILQLAFQILDIHRAAILMVNEKTGALEPRVVRVASGISPGGAFYSQHIVDYVRKNSVAALFSDAQMDSRLERAQSLFAQSICASMCAPLKPKDDVLGVLYVDNLSAAHRFSEHDLEFLTAFANQAAIAIDNSRLYRRIEGEAILRNNMMRFFPPSTIQRLLDSNTSLGTIDAEVTALFCDISGFTSISSEMEPRAVVDLLNEYFPVMSEIVFGREGTLEKYIGDALLAVWGAPFRLPDDADRAVSAAVEMQRALSALNDKYAAAWGRRLDIHIGLHTGRVAAGNIGSERYVQYATIGQATNLASRICGAAGPGEILVSDATVARLTHREKHVIEPMSPVRVKGHNDPLSLYRVRWQKS